MEPSGPQRAFGTRAVRRRAFLELVLPPAALSDVDRDLQAGLLAPFFGHDLGDQPAVVPAQLKAVRAYDATPRLSELAGLPTRVVSAEHGCPLRRAGERVPRSHRHRLGPSDRSAGRALRRP